jgi:hypothetical protein
MGKWIEENSKLHLTEEKLDTTYSSVVTYIGYDCLLPECQACQWDNNIDVWKVTLPENEEKETYLKISCTQSKETRYIWW